MSGNIWTVPATVLRVIDGDTLELRLDLGWRIELTARCRLAGVNAPEMSTEEGPLARQFVVDLLGRYDLFGTPVVPGPVTFISHQLDKYGRPLGQVVWTDHAGQRFDLSAELLEAGHAVPM